MAARVTFFLVLFELICDRLALTDDRRLLSFSCIRYGVSKLEGSSGLDYDRQLETSVRQLSLMNVTFPLWYIPTMAHKIAACILARFQTASARWLGFDRRIANLDTSAPRRSPAIIAFHVVMWLYTWIWLAHNNGGAETRTIDPFDRTLSRFFS